MSAGPDTLVADAYAAELRSRCRLAAVTAARLGLVLMPAFGLLDAVLFPAHVALFAALRIGCVAGIGLLAWLLGQPLGRRRPEAVALAVATLIVLTTDVMIAHTGGIESRYWSGLALVLLGVTVLMPWRPVWPLSASLIVIASYVVTVFAATGPTPDSAALTSNLCFLVSTGIIAIIGSRRASQLQWREFVQRAALEEALRHKSDFMAKMSHELRTPLHAIVGYADILLEEGYGDEAGRHLVERVRSRGVFLHRLISDLLDFAKVEAGRMEVSRQPVALRPLVEQIVATFGPLVERKGLAFEVRIADDLPVVAGDPHRLEQVLSNLLANALKFTDAGAITVDVRVVDAALPGFTPLGGDAGGPSGSMVGVFLGDTGVGIHTRDLRQLASDFQQLDGAGARFGGTGLGLSISRRLVDLLGGRLLVQSRHGSGSTFAVLLPVLDEVAAARRRRAAA